MQATYNLTDIIEDVAAEFGLTKTDSGHIVNHVFHLMRLHLIGGRQVRIHQFGTFRTKVRPTCDAINPITKSRIRVAEKKSLKFVTSPSLKEKL